MVDMAGLRFALLSVEAVPASRAICQPPAHHDVSIQINLILDDEESPEHCVDFEDFLSMH
jgi:hypothetical protein